MISWMQTHRKYLIPTIWISTIAFVGAGFVGWGAYSFGSNKVGEVAKVGERVISGKELQYSYNNVYSYYNQMLDGKLTQEKADELKLQDIALNQLIRDSLLLNYADELGITALNSEVASKIHSIDNFKENGVFSKDIYFKTLKAVNKKVREFEDSVKKEIIIDKLTKALNLPPTKLEIETLSSAIYLQDKLSVKIVKIDENSIKISDEELKEFWSKNKTNFMSDKSYTIEIVKVAADSIDVDENASKKFYQENKHLFKNSEDKIISYEDAKDKVKTKVQLKTAKKETLKKYLAFKNGKISADETLTLNDSSNDIPLDKIQVAKVGDFIKSIELKDAYIAAKLVSINMPEPLKFEDTKEEAKAELFKNRYTKLLESKTIQEANLSKELKDIGYISMEDSQKLDMLSQEEANLFLERLFSTSGEKGYYIFDDKSIVYKITEQKLSPKELTQENKEELEKTVSSVKNQAIQMALIERLESKYKIENYMKKD